MIKINHVTYHYHQMQMQFNLHIRSGEKVAILGPSGAGKSTLLSLIAGFIYPQQGTIYLNGQHHSCSDPDQRPVSMLFQENNLFAHLSVQQNIALGINPGLKLTAEQHAQLQAISQQVELSTYLTRMPAQLSGGQRQRVALARCLLRQQPILLLDEPFSSLDPALRNDMLNLVDTICQQQKLTLLMVTHNLDDALKIAPRALLIDQGQIIYDGLSHELANGTAPAARLLGIKTV